MITYTHLIFFGKGEVSKKDFVVNGCLVNGQKKVGEKSAYFEIEFMLQDHLGFIEQLDTLIEAVSQLPLLDDEELRYLACLITHVFIQLATTTVYDGQANRLIEEFNGRFPVKVVYQPKLHDLITIEFEAIDEQLAISNIEGKFTYTASGVIDKLMGWLAAINQSGKINS